MITDALLAILLTLCSSVFALLPSWTWPVPDEAIGHIVGEITRWDQVVPVTEMFVIMGIVATLFVALIAFKVVKQVIDWITAVTP
jgi:hypothetical protein